MREPEAWEEAVELDPQDPAALTRLDDSELQLVVARYQELDRRLRLQMAPLQQRLADLARQQAVVATEVRRRERQRHVAKRRQVREQVQRGQAPSLLQLAAAPDPPEFGEPSFTDLEFLLETGGVVALGYPGARVPSLQMHNGVTVATVGDLREARRLYGEGWEFGVPARAGVRVHTPGTKLERLLDAERCFVRPKSPIPSDAGFDAPRPDA